MVRVGASLLAIEVMALLRIASKLAPTNADWAATRDHKWLAS